MNILKNLQTLEKGLLFGTFFLFPLIFFPGFANAFATAKILLLALIAAILLIIKAVHIVIEKKIVLRGSKFDTALFLLVVGYLLSVIIVSPNKVEALIDPNRGALIVALLMILALISPKDKILALKASLAALGVGLVASVLSYFSLLGFLPQSLSFINTKGFNFWGNILSQIIYVGFFLALAFDQLRDAHIKDSANATLLPEEKKQPKAGPGLLNLIFVIGLLSLVINLYTLLKDIKPQFFPLAESWQISVDTLKNSRSALFGVGPANYFSLYTRSKPMAVNASPVYWNANVEYSRSALLHVFTEAGLVGIIALGLILLQLYRTARTQKMGLAIGALILAGVIFPISQAYWFLIFAAVYLLKEDKEPRKFDLKELDIFAYATSVAIVVLVLTGFFFYSKVVASDYHLGQSSIAAQNNQVQQVYELQVKAITSNPYNKSARNAFIQTNLALANALAQKEKPTEEDKQQYTQLIQQAITNARDAVTLNPQQADAWANLATVYQFLLGQVEDADSWTVASWQQAMAADPRNPAYYFSLGSAYYGLGNFEEASRFFEQAISLKSDMANYYYNLAYANYQKKDYVRAVNALEATLQYVKKGTDDYKKVNGELTEFKKMLPATQAQDNQELQPETLSQPETIPSGQPTIELPEDSAPPAISPTP